MIPDDKNVNRSQVYKQYVEILVTMAVPLLLLLLLNLRIIYAIRFQTLRCFHFLSPMSCLSQNQLWKYGSMEVWKATDPPSCVFRTPNTSSERREQYLTYLLVSIVAVFLFCNSLKFFLVFYDKFLDVGAMNITEAGYYCILSFR